MWLCSAQLVSYFLLDLLRFDIENRQMKRIVSYKAVITANNYIYKHVIKYKMYVLTKILLIVQVLIVCWILFYVVEKPE